jgi:hypothetical protein
MTMSRAWLLPAIIFCDIQKPVLGEVQADSASMTCAIQFLRVKDADEGMMVAEGVGCKKIFYSQCRVFPRHAPEFSPP